MTKYTTCTTTVMILIIGTSMAERDYLSGRLTIFLIFDTTLFSFTYTMSRLRGPGSPLPFA